MRRVLVTTVALLCTISMGAIASGGAADFEDLSLPDESYWNGSDGSGGFTSGQAYFNNNYDTTWGSWEGFAYSNCSQQTPPLTDWTSQYTAVPGSGQASANYAIGYVGFLGLPTMTLDSAGRLDGAYITNNNYTYYSMLNGDLFAKKFGGVDGNDEDWFLLTIEGVDGQGNPTGTVEFYLADYRFADNTQDYIVPGWTWVDLSGLGTVKKVTFSLSSSDVGDWGMNTPAYFAVDTFVIVPEPMTCLLIGCGGLAIVLYRRR